MSSVISIIIASVISWALSIPLEIAASALSDLIPNQITVAVLTSIAFGFALVWVAHRRSNIGRDAVHRDYETSVYDLRGDISKMLRRRAWSKEWIEMRVANKVEN